MHAHFRRLRRPLLPLIAVCGLAAALTACSSTPAATKTTTTVTTTTVAPGPPLTIAQLRGQYLSIVAKTQKDFASFSQQFAAIGGGGTNKQILVIVNPVISSLKTSATQLYDLRGRTTKALAKDIEATVIADNTVYQGLIDLRVGYGSRSFDLTDWGEAFASAIKTANSAANSLREALGLPPESSGNSGTSGNS
jgi:hypothetical protein